MKRVTVAVPEALMEAANHTHVVLGKCDHLNTYAATNFQDAAGNKYAVSSGLWSDSQIAGVTNPSALAGVNAPEGVDLSLVGAAQAAFELHENIALAAPNKIIARVGDNAVSVLESMRLVPINIED